MKTATQYIQSFEKKKGNRCCIYWGILTDSIEVKPRNFLTNNSVELYQAECIEKLLKYMIGNYCPTCGKQLRKIRKEK